MMKLEPWKKGLLFAGVLSLLIYIFSPNFLRLAKVYKQLQTLSDEIAKLQSQHRKLQDEIYSLKNDPVYVEKVAREELGMTKSKEIIYKFEGEEQ